MTTDEVSLILLSYAREVVCFITYQLVAALAKEEHWSSDSILCMSHCDFVKLLWCPDLEITLQIPSLPDLPDMIILWILATLKIRWRRLFGAASMMQRRRQKKLRRELRRKSNISKNKPYPLDGSKSSKIRERRSPMNHRNSTSRKFPHLPLTKWVTLRTIFLVL